MLTPYEHYQEAERLLEKADWPDNHPEGSKFYAMLGVIHALLANVSFPVSTVNAHIIDHHYTPGHNGMCAAGVGGGDVCGEPACTHALGAGSSTC